MKIDKSMVLKREIVGKRSSGDPVVMLITHGGLYAFFCKNEKGDIETLGMAPHKAIAAWMSEQKVRDIKWNDDFMKSESNELEDLKKNNEKTYIRLRTLIFSDALVKTEAKSDYYIIYDTKQITIGIMHKEEIQKSLDSGGLYVESFVRSTLLNEPCQFISQHKEFEIGR